MNKQIAAIRYKIDDTIFLFINGSPFEMNYITQKEKLPLGAFETAIREKWNKNMDCVLLVCDLILNDFS